MRQMAELDIGAAIDARQNWTYLALSKFERVTKKSRRKTIRITDASKHVGIYIYMIFLNSELRFTS